MVKRTAFVGLSGPLAYDYRTVGKRRGPNPILEGALGILLYYDEIVFVARGLCPANMRKLDYVHFLSDRDDFAESMAGVRNVAEIGVSTLYRPSSGVPDPMILFRAAMAEVTGKPRAMGKAEAQFAADYHATVRAGRGLELSGRSVDLRTVIADWEIISAFRLEHCDPVFNSASSVLYEQMRGRTQPIRAWSIADKAVVPRIPDYLGRSGPYHPCIEELRQSEFLRAFRDRADEFVAAEPSRAVEEICEEMEAKVKEYERDVFVQYLSRRNRYVSLAKAGIMGAAGLCVPGLGTLSTLAEEYLKTRRTKRMGWAGFLAQVDARGRA